jgi:hypothetical protein
MGGIYEDAVHISSGDMMTIGTDLRAILRLRYWTRRHNNEINDTLIKLLITIKISGLISFIV